MSTDAEGLALRLGGETATGSVTALAPGHAMAFDADRWRGCLVIVQSGVLRLQCRSGRTALFGAGSVLYFDGLRLDSLGADGDDVTVLVALHPTGHVGSGPAA